MEQREFGQHLLQDRSFHIFSENVGWILLSVDFVDVEVTSLQTLLDPQVSNMEIANLAEPAASAYADRRGGICMDDEAQVQAQSFGY